MSAADLHRGQERIVTGRRDLPRPQRHPEHPDVERLARARIGDGCAGGDLLACLLDLLDAERVGGPVRTGNYQQWARAAGFADDPELPYAAS